MLNKFRGLRVNLVVLLFCLILFQTGQTPTERVRKGDILNCAFYNTDSNAILKFTYGQVSYSRWSGTPGGAGVYKIETYDLAYSYNKQGMSGNINGVPFILLNKTAMGSTIFYIKYNSLIYVLSEPYSD